MVYRFINTFINSRGAEHRIPVRVVRTADQGNINRRTRNCDEKMAVV